MKLTHSLVLVAVAILDMDLEADGHIWGYALSKKSGVRSGVLYPQLDRMMGEGWLEDHWESPKEARGKRPPRRYYSVTEAGRSNLGAVVRRAASEPRFAGVKVRPA
jgi:PadR family transcriptional regulator PadR